MKLHTKIVLFLLVLSLVWLYTLIDLTYGTLFLDGNTFMTSCIGFQTQFKLVYALGIVLFVSYLVVIVFMKNNKVY